MGDFPKFGHIYAFTQGPRTRSTLQVDSSKYLIGKKPESSCPVQLSSPVRIECNHIKVLHRKSGSWLAYFILLNSSKMSGKAAGYQKRNMDVYHCNFCKPTQIKILYHSYLHYFVLDFRVQVCSPYLIKDIVLLQNVQRQATKLVSNLSYQVTWTPLYCHRQQET